MVDINIKLPVDENRDKKGTWESILIYFKLLSARDWIGKAMCRGWTMRRDLTK